MAGAINRKVKTKTPPEEDLLDDLEEAWAQYKQGKGMKVTSDEELDAFIDSL